MRYRIIRGEYKSGTVLNQLAHKLDTQVEHGMIRQAIKTCADAQKHGGGEQWKAVERVLCMIANKKFSSVD